MFSQQYKKTPAKLNCTISKMKGYRHKAAASGREMTGKKEEELGSPDFQAWTCHINRRVGSWKGQ